MRRRCFTGAAAAAAAISFSPAARAQAGRLPLTKGILLGMFPKEMPHPDRFQLAKEVGFDEMECPTIREAGEAEAVRDAARRTGVRIHSVMNSDHWQYPLSSADPAVVARGVECMEASLRNARFWSADAVLLVPAVVNPETSYRDAWERSQARIRRLIPLARELQVVIAVENVWNKFLLSPLEFARYIDEFASPWVRAYFDVGNVLLFGYPQDWIRTLGSRIMKVHLKDFRLRRDPQSGGRLAEFVPLREGDLDWKEVHRALAGIGYKGSATVEVTGGDRAALQEISRRVDLILAAA